MQVVKTRKPLAGLLIQSGLGRFADRMAAIVYGWAVLQQTGSGFWAGIVIAAHVAVLVLGTLYAGRLIARFGARPVALCGSWLSVVATTVIAVLLLHGPVHPLLIAAVSALGASLEGPSNVASETNYPEIARIARWDLLRLNAIDDSLDHMAGLVAPAAGAALIVAVGSAYGAVIIAALCLASALTLTASLPDFLKHPSAKATRLAPVLQHLRADPVLFPLTILFSLVMALLASIQFVILPLSVSQAGLDPTAVAKFLVAAAAGSLRGAAAAEVLQ
ncbi:MAG: MFS transporter, partial [Hyphomicrobium sp.]